MKIYTIRKYILAKNLKDALRLDKESPVDDCWVEDNTHKEILLGKIKDLKSPIGL